MNKKLSLTLIIAFLFFNIAFASGEFVTISGKVSKVEADSFNLMSQGRKIIVGTYGNNWDADGFRLVKGDVVIVTSKIDQDFIKNKKIEADSIYVKSLKTYFYKKDKSDEATPFLSANLYNQDKLPESTSIELQGEITDVNERNITVNTGFRKVLVSTKEMNFNPLDKVGLTRVKKGDQVKVTGVISDSFFQGKGVSAGFLMKTLSSDNKLSE